MKYTFLSCFSLLLLVDSFAQSSNQPVKGPTLAINFLLADFKTAGLINKGSIGSVLNNKDWARINDMKAGFGLQYLQGWNKYVDFSGRLNISFLDYPFRNKALLGTEKLLLETEAALHAKLLPDNYVVVPYAKAGLEASLYNVYFMAYIPVGAGLQFNLGNSDAFIFSNLQYSIPLTKISNYRLLYSIGFAASLKPAVPKGN